MTTATVTIDNQDFIDEFADPQIIADGIHWYYTHQADASRCLTMTSEGGSHTIVNVTLPEGETLPPATHEDLMDAILEANKYRPQN